MTSRYASIRNTLYDVRVLKTIKNIKRAKPKKAEHFINSELFIPQSL